MGNKTIRNFEIGKIILSVLIVLTIAFIFIQSMLSKDISGEESAAVSGWLSSFINESTFIGAFILKNLRKIAHFVEFGVLGAEFASYALLYTQKKKVAIAICLIIDFTIAFIDETIQIFSGRGAAIQDVWIDFFGALSFTAACVGVFALIRTIKERKE